MTLVQLFIPLGSDEQPGADKTELAALEKELVEAFGGATAFIHNPAVGLWQDGVGSAVQDKVVVFEVMTDSVDRAWWTHYKAALQSRLRQEEILIRTLATEKL